MTALLRFVIGTALCAWTYWGLIHYGNRDARTWNNWFDKMTHPYSKTTKVYCVLFLTVGLVGECLALSAIFP